MKVVILAAGSSTRLAELTKDKPKCLLPLGKTTILGKQLDNLIRVGLNEVIISAGYKIRELETYLKRKYSHSKLSIRVEFNPFFDISNNIMSLWNVRHLIDHQPIVIINGDNVFDHQVLQRLLEYPAENVLMIQKKDEYDGDDMKVQTRENRLLAVNKVMKSSQASGESIGVMRFSASGTRLLIQKMETMARIKENLQVWYLRAIQELIDEGLVIQVCSINGLQWEEVDFPEDYIKVSQMDWSRN
jgi:choline kinase